MVVHDDQLWFYINGFNWFTIIMTLVKSLLDILIGFSNLSSNFLYPYVDHWCNVPTLANLSQEEQRYLISPDGDGCHTYDVPWQNYTQNEIASWNWTTQDVSQYQRVECQHGWIYDESIFYDSTPASEVRR